MATLPEGPAPTPTLDTRWLRATQLAALFSILLVWAPWQYSQHPGAPGTMIFMLISSPLSWLYVYVLWQLRGKTSKKGLAVGAAIFLLIFLIVAVEINKGSGKSLVKYPGLFALVQLVLVVSAIKTYYSMPREPGDRRRLASVFLYLTSCVVLGLIAFFYWAVKEYEPPRPANEASAVGSLRTINAAAMDYQKDYKNGYPPSLAALGPAPTETQPSCHAAYLIDPLLASSPSQKSGYVFVYWPGPPVGKPAAGCPPGVKSYSVTARPLQYKKTGTRSFFTDETGIIRATTYGDEDRPATKDDPPI